MHNHVLTLMVCKKTLSPYSGLLQGTFWQDPPCGVKKQWHNPKQLPPHNRVCTSYPLMQPTGTIVEVHRMIFVQQISPVPVLAKDFMTWLNAISIIVSRQMTLCNSNILIVSTSINVIYILKSLAYPYLHSKEIVGLCNLMGSSTSGHVLFYLQRESNASSRGQTCRRWHQQQAKQGWRHGGSYYRKVCVSVWENLYGESFLSCV